MVVQYGTEHDILTGDSSHRGNHEPPQYGWPESGAPCLRFAPYDVVRPMPHMTSSLDVMGWHYDIVLTVKIY